MARAWTTSECGSMVKGAGANAVPPYRRLGSGGYRRGGAGRDLSYTACLGPGRFTLAPCSRSDLVCVAILPALPVGIPAVRD